MGIKTNKGIDIIVFKPRAELKLETLKQRAAKLHLAVEFKNFYRKSGTKFSDPSERFLFVRSHYKTDVVFEVWTRPADFDNFLEYLVFHELFFEPEVLASMKITRIDAGYTFKQAYSKVKRGLEVPRKQTFASFMASGEYTGSYSGNRKNCVRCYDKTEELRKNEGLHACHALSRIESQKTGKYVPFDNIYGLARVACGVDIDLLVAPLKGVQIHDVEMKELSEVPKGKLTSYFYLKGWIDAVGYQEAKRSLNKGNNFKKTYRPLLNVKSWINVEQGARECILQYFKPWADSKPEVTMPDMLIVQKPLRERSSNGKTGGARDL